MRVQPKYKKEKESNVIVMTGGHAGTTALSVVDEIGKRKQGWRLHWIGPKYAVEGKKTLTLEVRTMPKLGVEFRALVAGKLQRKWSRHTLTSLLKVPIGFVHAFYLLTCLRPNLVLSFGGYAAFPVVVAAFALRIPVVLQEQITGLGFANRMSLPFATLVAVSRKEGLDFTKGKGVLIGNPVNPMVAKLKPKTKIHKPPVIFIFAGLQLKYEPNPLSDSNLIDLPKLLSNSGSPYPCNCITFGIM